MDKHLKYIIIKIKSIIERTENILFVKWRIIANIEDILIIIEQYPKIKVIFIGETFIVYASERRVDTKIILEKMLGTNKFLLIRQTNQLLFGSIIVLLASLSFNDL